MILLELGRPLVRPPRLDLGGVDEESYALAGALRASPARLFGSVATAGSATAGSLVSGPALLRGSLGYTLAPLQVAGSLRASTARLRGAARVTGRRIANSAPAQWQPLSPRERPGFSFPIGRAVRLDLIAGVPWNHLEGLNPSLLTAWAQGVRLDAAGTIGWADNFRLLEPSYAVPWRSLPALEHAVGFAWGPALPVNRSTAVPWRSPPARDVAWLIAWMQSRSGRLDGSRSGPWRNPPPRDTGDKSLPWGLGSPPLYRVRYLLPAVVEPAPRTVRASYVCMDLKRPLDSALAVVLRLRRPLRTHCDLGSFIVNNSVDVITLADGLSLPVLGVSVSTDIGSFVWEISLTLPTLAEYNRLRPSAASDGARQIQITINGYVWRGFIDTVSRNRDFGADSFSAQGRSFTAYGATPYAPEKSYVSTADRLAQQLAAEAFEYLDFNIAWDAVDWIVPAGLFAYQDKDPMAALAQLCSAAGLVILPGRFDRSLVVRSRYPQTIWHWDEPGATIDGHLPLNQMVSGSSRFQAGNDVNRVFVSGTSVGNTVGCTRDGTSGDRLVAPIVDALLATDAVATERGRVELCKGGARIFNSYVTPLVSSSASGVRLRAVGELVAVDEDELDDFAFNGLITSLQVAAARTGRGELTVYQTIEVERHV